MERSRTEHLEEAVTYLEDIEDAVSEGGLGGGGGGIFAEVLGIGGDFAAEGAGAAADTVSGLATDVAGTAIGQAAGSVIAQQISGTTVSVEPDPLPVESDDSGGNRVTISPDVRVNPTIEPTIEPTFQPDLGPDISLPDLNLGIPNMLAVDREPLPVQRDPLPVERTEPIPVEDVGPVGINISTRGSGSTSTAPGQNSSNRSLDELFDDSLESGAKGALAGGGLGAASGAAAGGIGALPGAAIGAIGGGIFSAGTPFVEEGASRIGSALKADDQGDNRSTDSAPNITVEVDRSPTYNTTIDPSRLSDLADRIIREIEEGTQRDIDELRRDVEEIGKDLEELENEITRGR